MKNIILITIVLLVAGCTNTNNNCNITEIDTTQRDILPLSKIYSDYDFIKLSTDSTSVVGDINKLIVKNNKFYILSQKTILVFSNKGKFINKLDKKGKGDGEYLTITNFTVNNKGEITILDNRNGKISTYSENGKFLKQIKNKYFSFANSFIYLNKNIIAIFGSPSWAYNKRLEILNIKENKIINSYFDIEKPHRRYQNFTGIHNFHKKSSETLVAYPFNDTIFKIKKNYTIEPTYRIKQKYPFPNDFYDQNFTDIMDFFNKSLKYSCLNLSLFSNNKLLYSTFKKEKTIFDRYASFYFYKNNKCYTTDEYVDDLYTGVQLYLNKGFYLKSLTNNNAYYAIEPSNFIDWFGKNTTKDTTNSKNREIKKIMSNIDINQNPIIMVCKIK